MTSTSTEDYQVVVSPTVRRTLRRWLFWIGIATVILLFAAFGLAAVKGGKAAALSPTDPSPEGAKALVEVLKQQGVSVAITESLAETVAAISDPSKTTLVIHDPNAILSEGKLIEASASVANVVLIDPNFTALTAIAPGVALAGSVNGTAKADCPLTAVQKAETVGVNGKGYRLAGDRTTGTRCLGTGNKVYSLVQIENSFGTVTALGTTDALSNDFIDEHGNAALALNLLGQQKHLVWYVPGVEDVSGSVPTIGELSPGWVIQLSLLFAITVVAAAFWRGRRFGPLVVENLPVTVRASETMQGRARLYENASARLHALDSLRIGTVARLAVMCGLPMTATVDEVSAAAAAVTKRDPAAVHGLLFDSVPANDRQLVDLSDELLRLEANVAESVRP